MRLSDADAVGTFSGIYGCPNVCPTLDGVWAGTKGLSTHAGSTLLVPPRHKKVCQAGREENIS